MREQPHGGRGITGARERTQSHYTVMLYAGETGGWKFITVAIEVCNGYGKFRKNYDSYSQTLQQVDGLSRDMDKGVAIAFVYAPQESLSIY